MSIRGMVRIVEDRIIEDRVVKEWSRVLYMVTVEKL